MSDHSRALVPIETWAYNSPSLQHRGIPVDIGHLAESLIYYERILLNISNQTQLARVLSWFIDQQRFDALLHLITEGVLEFYEYSFYSVPILDPSKNSYVLMNVQDNEQQKPDSFERRFLYHKAISSVVQKNTQRRKLYAAFRGHVIEAKASNFGPTIDEARKDFANSERSALVIQAFVDEVFEFRKLGRPPKIECSVVSSGQERHTATINIDFSELCEMAGPNINWGNHTAISGHVQSCRFLQSASELSCDLFLANPMGRLAGDKLFESVRSVNKSGDIIETLKDHVEFPDVRALVNEGRLRIDDILFLRGKAKRFRQWLQSESDRDRDALIAYHHEIAKESGFTNVGRKALNLFGFVGGSAIGAAVGSGAGPVGSAVGAALGGSISWLADLGSKAGGPWRPVVFGNWFRDRISELDQGRRP